MSPSNQKFPSDVDKLLPDICGLYSFLHLCDGCEELMDLVLVHRFEISVVCRPQDGVCDFLSDDLGDPLCDTFLEANCCEAEDVLSVGFVLVVAVFVISGLTVLTRSPAALNAASTSLFLILIVDLYSMSALLMLLASTFILSDESLNNWCSRNRSICVRSVFTSLYA